jgi:hypothetical protein
MPLFDESTISKGLADLEEHVGAGNSVQVHLNAEALEEKLALAVKPRFDPTKGASGQPRYACDEFGWDCLVTRRVLELITRVRRNYPTDPHSSARAIKEARRLWAEELRRLIR